jgi:S-disulfanyl-L-cysteine oxidoreductase SoxD
MGAYTMRCSLKFLLPVMILAVPVAALAQSPTYNVGKPLSQEEIQGFDFMIGPQGQGLPSGHGTAKEGAAIFAKRCEVCHGQNGEKGVLRRLVLGSPGKPYRGPFKAEEKDSVAYYPYATIVWDYINRAMPVPKPGSLTHDEVYSLAAFLLYRNGIIQETDVMDAKSLPKVEMLRSGRAGVSPGSDEAQLVLSAGSRGHLVYEITHFSPATKSIWRPGKVEIWSQPLGRRRS